MSFNELIGNEKIKKELNETIKNNKLLHSYLFIGQEGIGKRKFAMEFAQMILCLSEDSTKPCRKCSSCVKFESFNNPDFVQLQPDGNSIKIAQIRQMQESIYEKPIISNKKVFIIDDCDKMTEEAQNSLLKTLEEPPEYVVIILITNNENKLLNTVRSRCVKISFNNIPKDDIIRYIKENNILKNPSNNIIDMCNGSIGKVEKIKENIDIYIEIEKLIMNLLNKNIRNYIELYNNAEAIYNSKDIIYYLLDYIMIIIYNYIKEEAENKYVLKKIEILHKIEEIKQRLYSNCNYDMCIDNLLLSLWEGLK